MNGNVRSWVEVAKSLPKRYPKTAKILKATNKVLLAVGIGLYVYKQNKQIADLQRSQAALTRQLDGLTPMVFASDDRAAIAYAQFTNQTDALKFFCNVSGEEKPFSYDDLFKNPIRLPITMRSMEDRTCRLVRPIHLG